MSAAIEVLDLSTVEEQLAGFVAGEVVRRREPVARDAPLVEAGLVDSLGLLQILVFLEKRYGVSLTGEGEPGDFRSIASLAAAVCRLRGARGA